MDLPQFGVVMSLGPYTFRPSAKLLHDPSKNRRIRLTDKETGILKFLYRAGAQVVMRQMLLNDVWGYNSTVTTFADRGQHTLDRAEKAADTTALRGDSACVHHADIPLSVLKSDTIVFSGPELRWLDIKRGQWRSVSAGRAPPTSTVGR
jgi:hypothetical protein